MQYNKPYLTIPQQVSLLESRGLIITDKAKAEHYLAKIGYYRLSGYSYIFRQITEEGEVLDAFKPEATFEDIHALYVFDKRLRLLLLDAIERIEIALRVDVALELGRHCPYSHTNPDYFHQKFVNPPPPKSRFDAWKDKHEKAFLSSSDDFAKHFKDKYPYSSMPIWMATELWDFGMLSKLIGGVKDIYIAPIARNYDVQTYRTFRSWTRTINVVRNICAHHGRLWNRVLAISPLYPNANEAGLLAPLKEENVPANRLFATLCIIQYFMGQISPNSTWKQRLQTHLQELPVSPYISPNSLGAPADWESWTLWQNHHLGA